MIGTALALPLAMPFWLIDRPLTPDGQCEVVEEFTPPSWWQMLRPQGPKAHRSEPSVKVEARIAPAMSSHP